VRTLHVPFHFYPEAVGGTEVYALSLGRELAAAGHDVHIAAPGQKREEYRHEGFPVHRFVTGPVDDVSKLYDEGDPVAARQFGEILSRTEPELVHLHGISPAVSVKVIREIKRRGIPIVLTVHIPGILCSRGTMLRYGTQVCDGKVEVYKCSRCVLNAHGLPKLVAQAAGTLPTGVGHLIGMTGRQANWVTGLRMTELMALRLGVMRTVLGEVDQIVAVSEWLRQALLRNGVPSSKLTLCRHGVTQEDPSRAAGTDTLQPGSTASKATRIAFIGRLNEAKGAHVLVDAVLRCHELPLRLDVYGIVQGASGSGYAESLISRSSHDSRIRFLPPIENGDVIKTLRSYDAVAIPSLWMETGPLVVYDAFAAGVPVVGSRRGGIVELVTHEVNGLLVEPPENASAWAEALKRICTEPGLPERLSAGIRKPRTMREVALEMLDLYSHLVQPAMHAVHAG
jgi:glycosyltransferase involved in cell wall biosynthesis